MKAHDIINELREAKEELTKSNYRSPYHLSAVRKRYNRLKKQLKAISNKDAEVAKIQLRLL